MINRLLIPNAPRIEWDHLSNVIPVAGKRFTFGATLQIGPQEWKSVIIKTATREFVDPSTKIQLSETIIAEATLINSLASFPGFVRLEGHGFVSSQEFSSQVNDYFFVVEHPGRFGLEDLLSVLNSIPKSPATILLQIVILRGLADALSTLHSERLVYKNKYVLYIYIAATEYIY